MFASRSLNKSFVAVQNIVKYNKGLNKLSGFQSHFCKKKYNTDSGSYRNDQKTSSNWFAFAAGGAILVAGLNFYGKSSALADELVNDQIVIEEISTVEKVETSEELSDESSSQETQNLQDAVEETQNSQDAVEETQNSQDSVEETQSVQESSTEETSAEEEVIELPTFPAEVEYLLIGGGTASYSAMRAIRKYDVTAKVLIVTDEEVAPYMRPPLSKELWFSDNKEASRSLLFKQWNGKMKSLYYQEENAYCPLNELTTREEGGVAFAPGKKVALLNVPENTAIFEDGSQVKYKKCLIATGGVPKSLPVVDNASEEVKKRISIFRKLGDYLKLDEVTDNVESVTIVGGGFLGSELACSLGFKGKLNNFKVNQIFKESGNMAKVLPEYLTKWTTKKVEKEGVNVIPNTVIDAIDMSGEKVKLTLSNGDELLTDHVVMSVGLDVDTSLSLSGGLEVDDTLGGYRVNAELQARSNVWVAGDASCFYDPILGRRRVEHHDHAVVSGRLAGGNMTGRQRCYIHQSMFWSDLGPDVGYEAIGVVDSKLPTVAIFAKATEADTPVAALNEGIRDNTDVLSEGITSNQNEVAVKQVSQEAPSDDYGRGAVFYLKDEKIVGVLLWNVFGRMSVARKIIREQKKHNDFGELAKLFRIGETETES